MKFIRSILSRSMLNHKMKRFQNNSKYIDLETPCLQSEYDLITKNAARCTLIKVHGNINIVGDEEHDAVCRELLLKFQALFKGNDCAISWMHEEDPFSVEDKLREDLRPTITAAQRHGLDGDLVFEDLVKRNADLSLVEDNVIAIWTYPTLDQEMVHGHLVNVRTENIPLKEMHDKLYKGSANPFLSDFGTLQKHASNVKSLIEAFDSAEIVVEKMTGKEAGEYLLMKANPDKAKHTPIKTVDQEQLGLPSVGQLLINPDTGEIDTSGFGVPTLADQIGNMNSDEDEVEDGIIKVGSKYFATMSMSVYPKQITRFTKLRKELKGIPYRMTSIIKPKPTDLISQINEGAARLFGGLSEENRETYRELKVMGASLEEHDYSAVNWQVGIVTWSKNKNTLKQQMKVIETKMSVYGRASVVLERMGAFQSYFSSIPGLSAHSYADAVLISIDRLIPMLQHGNEFSMNEHGGIAFRHSSGKLCYYTSKSDRQVADCTIFLAHPRQGKSVLMNTKAIISLMSMGSSTLPLITNMDIGPSSEGSLHLMRVMFEKHMSKERAERLVVSHEWNPNNGDWKKNPCDIRFGSKTPSELERNFIINFYSSVCSDAATGVPPEGGAEAIQATVDLMFQKNATGDAKKVNPALAPELIKLAEQYGVSIVDERFESNHEVAADYISYFDLRDQFYRKGCTHGATKAHLYAMPTADDLLTTLRNNPELTKKMRIYDNLLEKLANKLLSHISRKQYLVGATTLDFTEAHVISMDMKPVADDANDNEGRLRLFTEYMLAMNTSIQNYFIHRDILKNMPPLYHEYWADKIEKYSMVEKHLTLDEWHALSIKKVVGDREISVPVGGSAYVEYLIKQAPKWNLSINIATHSSSDLTKSMKGNATNIFLYSGFTSEEIPEIQRDFSLSNYQAEQLKTLKSPNAERGTNMMWIYKGDFGDIKRSQGTALVEFLCSGPLMWGLNTSASDMPHKFRLHREFPDEPWLEGLVEAFPDGSMQRSRKLYQKALRQSQSEEDLHSAEIEAHLYRKVVKAINQLGMSKEMIAECDDLVNRVKSSKDLQT
ncbi:hypothetical protein AAFX24_28455 [Vibrio mediterranei]|uniref:hypothetical protein n=1 Tax=Vibrio mediterranei TaxID=689 RepID=UPI0038CE5F46